MMSSAKPPRRILLRTIAVIIALLAVVAALIAGVLAPYYLSTHIAQTSLLTLTALVTFAIIVWLGMRLSAALWRTNRPARLAAMTSGVLTAAFLSALYLLILRPTPPRYTDVIPADHAKSWRLSTDRILRRRRHQCCHGRLSAGTRCNDGRNCRRYPHGDSLSGGGAAAPRR